MLCKWCGAEINPTHKKCDACKREIPPLSDCGGFYHLVPDARQIGKNAAAPENPTAVDVNSTKKKTSKFLVAYLTAVSLLIVILLIVQLFQMKSIRALERRLEAQSELQSMEGLEDVFESQSKNKMQNQINEPSEAATDEHDQESLNTKAVQFKAFYDEDLAEFDSKSNLDGYPATMDIRYIFSDVNGKSILETVGYIEPEIHAWHAELEKDNGEEGWTLRCQYSAEENLFGAVLDSSYIWEYRVDEDEQWCKYTGAESDASEIDLSYETLSELAEDGTIEFRCKITQISKTGGSLNIVLGTLTLSQENTV